MMHKIDPQSEHHLALQMIEQVGEDAIQNLKDLGEMPQDIQSVAYAARIADNTILVIITMSEGPDIKLEITPPKGMSLYDFLTSSPQDETIH